MKLKFTFLIALTFGFFNLSAQVNAGSLGMNRIGHWDGSPSNNTTSGVYYNDIWGYVDGNGKEYAILGTPKRIYFIDVSTPASPSVVDFFVPGGTCIWRDFKTYGKYAYAVSEFGGEGLLVYNMTGLDSGGSITLATQLNGSAHFNDAHNIFIDEANARLYVAGASLGGSSYDIVIYSLANPAAPSLLTTTVAQTNLPGGYVHDIFVKNNIAFASHGGNGVYVYDASNATNWVFKDSYAEGGYNHSSWITEDDNFLIFAEESNGRDMVALDVSDLNNISKVAKFAEPLLTGVTDRLIAHNPFIRGDKLIVANYEDGTTIYDLAPLYNTAFAPAAPELEAYYDTYNNGSYSGTEGNWGTYPFFPSGNIVSSDINTGLYILSPDIPLPIQLKTFDAKPQNRNVAVEWSTAAEKNNDFFTIERSEDGKRFEAIGKINGAGTTGAVSNYFFLDESPIRGTSYYRLKQTDFDGTFSYSRTVAVEFGLRKSIKLTPSLLTQGTQITIDLRKFDGENATFVRIFDAAGKAYLNRSFEVSGNDSQTFDVSELPSGIYQVHVQNGYHRFTEKLVVIR